MRPDLSDPSIVRAIIDERHWGKKESLRSIERDIGVGKTVLQSWCKRHGITVRSRIEQVSITNREFNPNRQRGETHWAWGLRKETSPTHAAHSARMKKRNPMGMDGIPEKTAISLADAFRRNAEPHELIMNGFLSATGTDFVFQHPIGRYVADFAFLSSRVILEIDGKNHWSQGRKSHDRVRTTFLLKQGWKILRVSRQVIRYPSHIFDVLKKYIPGLKIPGGLPPRPRKGTQYRVLVCDAETPAGRKE